MKVEVDRPMKPNLLFHVRNLLGCWLWRRRRARTYRRFLASHKHDHPEWTMKDLEEPFVTRGHGRNLRGLKALRLHRLRRWLGGPVRPVKVRDIDRTPKGWWKSPTSTTTHEHPVTYTDAPALSCPECGRPIVEMAPGASAYCAQCDRFWTTRSPEEYVKTLEEYAEALGDGSLDDLTPQPGDHVHSFGPRPLQFVVGKVYRHASGRLMRIICEASTTMGGPCLVAEEAGEANLIPVGIGPDYCVNYTEVPEEEWWAFWKKRNPKMGDTHFGVPVKEG